MLPAMKMVKMATLVSSLRASSLFIRQPFRSQNRRAVLNHDAGMRLLSQAQPQQTAASLGQNIEEALSLMEANRALLSSALTAPSASSPGHAGTPGGAHNSEADSAASVLTSIRKNLWPVNEYCEQKQEQQLRDEAVQALGAANLWALKFSVLWNLDAEVAAWCGLLEGSKRHRHAVIEKNTQRGKKIQARVRTHQDTTRGHMYVRSDASSSGHRAQVMENHELRAGRRRRHSKYNETAVPSSQDKPQATHGTSFVESVIQILNDDESVGSCRSSSNNNNNSSSMNDHSSRGNGESSGNHGAHSQGRIATRRDSNHAAQTTILPPSPSSQQDLFTKQTDPCQELPQAATSAGAEKEEFIADDRGHSGTEWTEHVDESRPPLHDAPSFWIELHAVQKFLVSPEAQAAGILEPAHVSGQRLLLAFLQACSAENEVGLVKRVVEHVIAKGVPLFDPATTVVVDVLGRSQPFPDFLHGVVSPLRDAGSQFSNQSVAALAEALVSHHAPGRLEPESLYRKLVSFGKQAGICKSQSGVLPSQALLRAVTRLWQRTPNTRAALHLCQRLCENLEKRFITPYPHILELFARMVHRSREFKRIGYLLHLLYRFDDATIGLESFELLLMCASLSHSSELMQSVIDARWHKLPDVPSSLRWRDAELLLHASKGNTSKFEEEIQARVAEKQPVTPGVFVTFLKANLNAGDVQGAEAVADMYSKTKQPVPFMLLYPLYAHYVEQGQVMPALSVLGRMVQHGLYVNEDLVARVEQLVGESKALSTLPAREVLKKLRKLLGEQEHAILTSAHESKKSGSRH